MRYGLKLLEVRDPRNQKIVVKRLANDRAVDIHQAEALLHRLPQDIMRNASDEEVQKVAQDYERLGCRIQKIWEQEKNKEPEPRPETLISPVTPHVQIHRTAVSSSSLSGPFSFVTSVDPALKKASTGRGREILTVIISLAVMALLVYALSHLKSRKAGLAIAGKGDSTTAQAALMKATTEEAPAPEPSESREPADTAQDEQRIRALEKKITENPDDDDAKETLSSAYENKAKEETSPDFRIKFFQMAIGFNRYNETAWDGLINAYREAGSDNEARKTVLEKEVVFRDANQRLSRILNSFGPIEDIPQISSQRLTFAYRTEKRNTADLESEMRVMAMKIRKVRKFERIRITGILADEKITQEY